MSTTKTNSYVKQLEEQVAAMEEQVDSVDKEMATINNNNDDIKDAMNNILASLLSNARDLQLTMEEDSDSDCNNDVVANYRSILEGTCDTLLWNSWKYKGKMEQLDKLIDLSGIENMKRSYNELRPVIKGNMEEADNA